MKVAVPSIVRVGASEVGGLGPTGSVDTRLLADDIVVAVVDGGVDGDEERVLNVGGSVGLELDLRCRFLFPSLLSVGNAVVR